MQVTFVETVPKTVSIVLQTEFPDVISALNKMEEVQKNFKRLYPDHVILVTLKNPSVAASDSYLLA